MKTRAFVLMISFLLIVSVSFAGDVEKYCGTWVNTDYNDDWHKAKWIINPDGSGMNYFNTWDTTPSMDNMKFLVEEKWVDSEENTFFKVKRSWYGDDVWNDFFLMQINSSGTICEWVKDMRDFPTKIDPNDFEYYVFYRYQ